MKKINFIISLFVGVVVIIAIIILIIFAYSCYESIDNGKQFIIVIEEDEVVDYKAVNQKQYINGFQRKWFTMLQDKELEKLVRYMKENNYKIVPGTYYLYQGYRFNDLLSELQFEEITQAEELDTPRLISGTPDNSTQCYPYSFPSQ